MDKYFDDFKKKMKNKMRIPKSVVHHYFDDICFMVDTNFTYAEEILPRVARLRPMKYKVNVDEVTILLYEEIDKNAEPFRNYETTDINMIRKTKVPKIDKK